MWIIHEQLAFVHVNALWWPCCFQARAANPGTQRTRISSKFLIWNSTCVPTSKVDEVQWSQTQLTAAGRVWGRRTLRDPLRWGCGLTQRTAAALHQLGWNTQPSPLSVTRSRLILSLIASERCPGPLRLLSSLRISASRTWAYFMLTRISCLLLSTLSGSSLPTPSSSSNKSRRPL